MSEMVKKVQVGYQEWTVNQDPDEYSEFFLQKKYIRELQKAGDCKWFLTNENNDLILPTIEQIVPE